MSTAPKPKGNTRPGWSFPLGEAVCLLIFASLALLGCSRPETKEYFTEATGIELCDEAVLKNVTDEEDGNQGLGFIYRVDVYMNAECSEKLFRELELIQMGRHAKKLPADELMSARKLPGRVRFTYIG